MSPELPHVVPYEDAIRSDDGLLRLKAHTLGAVSAMVPNSVAGLIGVTRRQTIEGAVARGSDPSIADVRERFLLDRYVEDPFASKHVVDSGATVLGLDDLDDRAVGYRWHLKTLGLGDRVTMYLRSAGTIVAVIALGRSLEQRRFTHDEALGLRRIQPLIERAYLCGVEPRADSARTVLLRAGLSARETDIAELVGRAATNADIARSLHLSEATVKSHLTRIFAKTGVRTRTQLALLVGEQLTTAIDG
jgi:DNA-binding CsgD family transcriptional regulator